MQNDTEVISNGQVCTEVDTFITLNISTETEKWRGPNTPQRVELRPCFGVTRDLIVIGELGEKIRLPSRSSRSSTMMPCANPE